MSLIIRIPDVTFSDATLPKLYRDAIISAGTVFVYDALNPASWEKQAAPAAGSPSAKKWVNLVSGTADGLFTTPSGELLWGASGGFVGVGNPFEKITALNGATPTTLGSTGKAVAVLWLKHGSENTVANQIIFNCGAVGLKHDGTTNRFLPFSNGAGQTANPTLDTTTIVGDVVQVAVSVDNVTRLYKFYLNGVEVAIGACYTNAVTAVCEMLSSAGYSPSYKGTLYRWIFDRLTSGESVADFVARDYASNVGRFS